MSRRTCRRLVMVAILATLAAMGGLAVRGVSNIRETANRMKDT